MHETCLLLLPQYTETKTNASYLFSSFWYTNRWWSPRELHESIQQQFLQGKKQKENSLSLSLSLSLCVLVSYKCSENELDPPEWQVTGTKHRLHGENKNLVKACSSSAAAIRSASWKEKWSRNWTWRWARAGAEEEENTKEKFSKRSTCILTTQLLLRPLPVPEPSKNQGMRYRIIHPSTIFRSLRESTKFAHDKAFSFITCEAIREQDEVFVQKPAKNPRSRRAFRPKPAAQ